jgi:hypothetical protein
MLTKCVNCGFYVRQDDVFCLNCGFTEPQISKTDSRINFRRVSFITFGLTLLTLLILGSAIFKSQDLIGVFFLACTSIALGFTLALLIECAVSEIREKNKNVQKASGNAASLNSKKKVIEKRIAELAKRGQKIDAVLDKIKQNDGQNLQEVRRKLLAAREIVISQLARYEIQKRKIELVRLQNSVSPYLFGFEKLSEAETENSLAAIEEAKFQINRIRQNLTRYDAIDFPGRAMPEKQNFLAQLAETENSCERLRETLLARQAMRALEGVQPLEDALHLPNTKQLAHAADTFNIQATLTDFSETFDELEREYKRIESDNEMSRSLFVD